MKVYTVSCPGYPVSGTFHPTREDAEAEQRRREGSVVDELEFDDYSDDARGFYESFPGAYPKPPFPVAIDNLMARYADDSPAARAGVLESAARVLRGQR